MRFLKRLIISVLVYIGVYLPFIAVLQAVSGGDYTAAYSVGGIVSAVELALGSVIKITENKSIKKGGESYDGCDVDRGVTDTIDCCDSVSSAAAEDQ